jgi:hypothetical protein
MRAKGPIRVLVLLLAVSLLPTMAVLAHHGPTAADVLAKAQSLGMGCESTSTEIDCTGGPASPNESPSTVIEPASGPLTQVVTRVNAHTNGIHDFSLANRDWFAAIHEVGCADSQPEEAAVRQFMDKLAAQFEPSSSGGGTYGPLVVGECSMKGSLLQPDPRLPWYWEVTSNTRLSAFPTPTPTASPTPSPTPKPTATPRPTATPTPTATPKPGVTPQPTVVPTAAATPTAPANASESVSASATATASASTTPEQTVAGVIFTPEPSSAPPGAAGRGNDWEASVPSASDVSTDGANLAGSALAALLLLLAMGFIGELFNNTFEANYDRILAGWNKSWLGRLGRAFGGLWGGGK